MKRFRKTESYYAVTRVPLLQIEKLNHEDPHCESADKNNERYIFDLVIK